MSCNQTTQFENLEVTCTLEHQGSSVGFYGTTPIAKPAALTAADASSLNIVYATNERDVLANVRTRLNEIETKLRSLGLLT